jgi:parallel beta-helix repeat protein
VPGTGHTTDGNGIIIDDFRRTQSDHVPYPAATLVIGNFVYENGGRGIHVYQSDRVDVVNNTVSGDSLDPLLSSVAELSVASSSQVRLINNIVSARGARFPAVSARASSGPATDNMWEGNLVAVGRVAIAGGGMAAGPGNLVGVAAGFAKNAAQLAFPAAFALARTSPAVLSGVPLAMAVVDRAGHAVAAGQAVNRGADMLPE